MKIKNNKLKISEFEKYSLSSKSQTLIKGGLTDSGEGPGDPDNGGWDPNDPNGTGGGPGGSSTVGVLTKPKP